MKEMKARSGLLNNNHLKLLAMLTMLCDHIGVDLLPEYPILRIIGRLAYPIFAYMIAEGCTYTRHKGKYFRNLALLAILCQAVYFFAIGSLYQNILVTFSLSVLTIFSIDLARTKKTLPAFLPLTGMLVVVFVTCEILPQISLLQDFRIDYGIWGVLLPVAVYIAPTKPWKLLVAAIMLTGLAVTFGGVQWYALCALPLLALYDGTRGKYNLKYLFYIFYPAHLAAIYLVGLLL